MIALVVGTNSYAAKQTVDALAKRYYAEHGAHSVERYEAADIEPQQLAEVLTGVNLFATERLVIIKNVLSDSTVRDTLLAIIERIAEGVHVVLVETSPDKRTKLFKLLQKNATIATCDMLSEQQATQWLVDEARAREGTITRDSAAELVRRVGTDQWQLSSELGKLLLIGDTSKAAIERVVERTPQADVFALLDAALGSRPEHVRRLLIDVQTKEEPYQLFGLLAAQVFQLSLLHAGAGKRPGEIAADTGMHPYPLQKMQPIAAVLDKKSLRYIVNCVSDCDLQLKSSVAPPWTLLEQALMKIATRAL